MLAYDQLLQGHVICNYRLLRCCFNESVEALPSGGLCLTFTNVLFCSYRLFPEELAVLVNPRSPAIRRQLFEALDHAQTIIDKNGRFCIEVIKVRFFYQIMFYVYFYFILNETRDTGNKRSFSERNIINNLGLLICIIINIVCLIILLK